MHESTYLLATAPQAENITETEANPSKTFEGAVDEERGLFLFEELDSQGDCIGYVTNVCCISIGYSFAVSRLR